MKRAIATFAHGAYTELLDISRPTFEDYAERHGYDFIEELPAGDRTRPPAWWKVPALLHLLTKYDAVLWLGCDVYIVDGTEDIADGMPKLDIQAMVAHYTPEGEIPNTDVWYVTQGMLPWLDRAWAMDKYTNHVWWEQAAILDLMGYNPTVRPLRVERDTELYDLTHFLPLEWNSHESADRHPAPRFAHATHGLFPWRKAVMEHYAAVRRTK